MVTDQPSSIAYATNGSTTVFPFPYYTIDPSTLVVTVKDSTGAVTTKVLNTDFTFTGVKDTQHLNAFVNGGQIVFGTAPATGGQVRITRKTPKTQPATFINGDPFPSGTHEASMDRQMLVIQEFLSASQIVAVGDGPPTSGLYNFRDIIWNANPVPGGTIAWINLQAGQSAGTWYEWGNISR